MIEVKEKEDGKWVDHEIIDVAPNIEATCKLCDNCKIKQGVMDKDSLIFDEDVDIRRRYSYLLYKYTSLLNNYVELQQKHLATLRENNKTLKDACRILGLEDDGK